MEKYNLSKEVKEIMDSARQFAENNNLKRINLETVLFTLIDKYLGNFNVESEVIKKLLNKLKLDAKTTMRKECLDLMLIANKSESIDPDLDDYINKENITLADNLANTFDRAKEILDKGIMINTGGKITSEVLLYSGLFEVCDMTGLLDAKYRINTVAILAQNVFKSITAELKNDELDSGSKESENDEEEFEKAGEMGAISTKERDPNSKTPTLDEFSLDMTKKAKKGEYDPVIGRNKEISQICEILCCRKKNNAILLGDPGAGKTAIVELLAQKIAAGDVADELKGKRVLSLSTTDLTSGTMYRGQLEQRVQNLCKELAENRNIILYIDEFQQATSDSSSSIAQMLKPALGRGEITLIASTTIDEYRKFIEKDGALKRRFSPVQVEEPSVDETVQILEGIQDKYSGFHHVQYSPGLMKKIAEWAGKYINDRYFPDKAISILDMASSLCKLGKPVDSSKVVKLEKQLETTKAKIKELVETCDKEKIREAGELREKEKELKGKIEKAKSGLYSDPKNWPVVSEKEVSEVISKSSGIPVDKIMSSDMKKLREIKTTLGNKVIGQNEAVEQLTLSLQRNMLGLRDPKRPIASFLFLGPTGVGKTKISQVLAEEFFGSEKNLITIACSEYTQDFSESKLIGASSGYIGYDDEPRLYALKRKPYSVLLIDEIEKASENLQNIFLNILEEGQVTLSSGEVVSCKNCIVIFTGNVGTKSLELYGKGMGFGVGAEETGVREHSIVMKEVKKTFRPEFINRLSKIIVFNSLGKEEMDKIFYLELDDLKKRLLENNGYKLEVTDKIKDVVVSKCEPQYGARSLKRLLVEYVEQEICKAMLEQDIEGKDKITVDFEDEKVKVEFDKSGE
jgi:ATP-dependent Clp protease ATP-binding subunit ClpC